MDSRDAIFQRVRTALGRKLGQKPEAPPEPLLRIGYRTPEEKVARFRHALEALGGTVTEAAGPEEARAAVDGIVAGRESVVSPHPFLASCGLSGISYTTPEELRNACASAVVGITSAYCLLAETGTIVLRATPEEPRLLSLLPPVHIAVVPRERLLTNLDEMLSMIPRPVDDSSAMVLVTGPSRTGDIEQFLVRGVHGPGEVHVVIAGGKTK